MKLQKVIKKVAISGNKIKNSKPFIPLYLKEEGAPWAKNTGFLANDENPISFLINDFPGILGNDDTYIDIGLTSINECTLLTDSCTHAIILELHYENSY